jgi:hypothetical protein
MHLFFLCDFSKECWTWIGIHWNTQIAFFNMIVLKRDSLAHLETKNDTIFEKAIDHSKSPLEGKGTTNELVYC